MSAVLKSDGIGLANLVKPHRDEVAPASLPEVDHEGDLLKARIKQLEAEVAQATQNAQKHEALLTTAAEQARTESYEQGLRDAQTLENERVEALRKSAHKAAQALENTFADAEALAVLLARTCLETMFGTGEGRAQIACDLIHNQLDKLAHGTLIVVKVSTKDFADELAIDALAKEVGLDRSLFELDDGFAAGDVRMGLGLGQIELGITQQWASLREIIDDWAHTGTAT